jgi:sulfite reductase alpha subunit-like flavoprotein
MIVYDPKDPILANVDVHNTARWSRLRQSRNVKVNPYDSKNPYLAKIVVNRELHTPESNRSCRHIEIQVPPEFK